MNIHCPNCLKAGLQARTITLVVLALASSATSAPWAEGEWDPRFFLPGIRGTVHAIAPAASSGSYVGGDFDAADDVAASNVARWSGTNWTPLGDGIGGPVLALASSGQALYAGGTFTQAGGVPAQRVARWDGTNWTPLGGGIQGESVNALALDATGALYAAGDFTNAGGVAALNVARWDGIGWSALSSGLGNGIYPAWVRALAVHGTDLYAGGFFTDAGGTSVDCIARWDGSAWFALGSGVDDRDYLPQVMAITFVNEDLHIGGAFALSGNTTVNHVARWNGASWVALGSGLTRHFGDVPVTSMTAHGSDLIVGGRFTAAGGSAAVNLARWNGSSWSEFAGGAEATIMALGATPTSVLVGGSFALDAAEPVQGIAAWTGDNTWQDLTRCGGLSLKGERFCTLTCNGDEVNALVRAGFGLYVAGSFAWAGDLAAGNVARWTGTAWEALGPGLDGPVHALALGGPGLAVGGDFTHAGGGEAFHVALWNGAGWSPLAGGVNGPVRALAWDGDRLYAAGDFTSAGAIQAMHVAVWNGATWAPLGEGIEGSVRALAVGAGGLFAGGQFSRAGAVEAANIAFWNGSAWVALDQGVHGVPNPSVRLRPPPVSTLLWHDNRLWVGGDFAVAGSTPATNVACWNGTSWLAAGGGLPSTLGGSPPSAVAALSMQDGILVAGGSFNRVQGQSAQGLAFWDGASWTAIEDAIAIGLYAAPVVRALAMDDSNLYVGGHFKFAGGEPASGFCIRHAPPRLRIDATAEGRIRLSWPAWATRYGLQMLDGWEEGPWTNVTDDAPIVGEEHVRDLAPTGRQRFYRLRRD